MQRRTLITGAAAAAAMAAIERPARAVTTGVIPIAIRWDSWYSTTLTPRYGQNTLSPSAFQFRAPWFCTQPSTNKVDCAGSQANMDMEIRLAAQAGIKCFAFDTYLQTVTGGNYDANMVIGWNLYNSSAYKSLVKWCALPVGIGCLGSATNNWASNDWHASCDFWLPYFAQTNYQTVTATTAGRPLFLVLWQAANVTTYFQGSNANVAAAITYLRSRCAATGLGNPYIVVLTSSGAGTVATAIGADAVSSYDPAFQFTALPNTYASLDTYTQTFWATQASSFATTIPDCITGWDRRPRYNTPEPYSHGALHPFRGNLQYVTPGTTTEVANHLQAGIDYIGANPAVVPTKALLIYSWCECTEGGNALIPTIGDPPTNTESGQALTTSNMLKAVGPVLRAAA